ncbi:MAG TPA: hypothetical protein VFM70_12430 [Salinimicrobium sp.]|nr:hypothetical protein [Salinimicrobium sp.]
MMQNYIQFKKQREVGEILNDTFKFLRENFKPLFKIIIKTVGPAFLFLALAIGYYSYLTVGTMNNPFIELFSSSDVGEVFLGLGLLFVAVVVYMSLLYGTILHYIKSYIQNKGTANLEEVQDQTKNDFGSLFGLTLLVGIILIFGLLLCLLPGIYLSVPLSLVFSILVFDKLGISESITESFRLVKNNWWMTFVTFLVIMIIVYVISFVFSIPLIIYTLFKGITMVEQGSAANPAEMFDWVYVTLNIITSLFQYLLYIITTIATAFIYFNLKEKKYFTGTYETIEGLGKDHE